MQDPPHDAAQGILHQNVIADEVFGHFGWRLA
jgi:hypothetical protein